MMGTAISRSACGALGAALLTLAGCGGASAPQRPATAVPAETTPASSSATARVWHTVAIPSGASLAVPPGWRLVRGDPGTATAVLFGAHEKILGYLNITPRQAAETLGTWASFRVRHNAKEGDHAVRTLGQPRLRFASSRSRCVRDSYVTKTGAHYVELACLVTGRRAGTVIVGAAPPREWPRVAPEIAQAFRRLRS